VQQLQALHVQSAQGYWFSRPLASRAFHDLLMLRKTYALPLAPSVHLAH
jgi:EAL domain-containing protein (putative c-di-GMP-specific phosphodiesterase class I)